MSAPRPCMTDRFIPSASISFLVTNSIDTAQRSRCFLRLVHSSVSWYGAYLTISHALLWKQSFYGLEPLFMSCCAPYGTCWCLRTRQLICAHAHLLTKQKVLKNSLRRKSQDCSDPNETVDRNINYKFPDEEMPIKLDSITQENQAQHKTRLPSPPGAPAWCVMSRGHGCVLNNFAVCFIQPVWREEMIA